MCSISDKRIAGIVVFIEKNLDKNITSQRAARMAHLSYSHFAALFKKETGKQFGEYQREQRVAKAQFLLRNPGLEIKEACFLMRSRHLPSFYRDFKKIAGETPGQFKKGHNRSY